MVKVNVDNLSRKEPDSGAHDKIHFLMNNISSANAEKSCLELGQLLTTDNITWFASYLIGRLAGRPTTETLLDFTAPGQ